MSNQKIIIADICSINKDGKSPGHYFPVAQNYIEMFHPKNQVLVAGGPIYKNRFNSCHLELPYDYCNGTSKITSKIHELLNCIALFRKAKGDIIVMQCVAQITTYIAILLFYHKKSKLFLIQYYTESINSKYKKGLWNLMKNKVDGIICSSDRVGQSFNVPYIVVTDYIKTGTANQPLPYEDRKYDFCLIGGIFRDKGQVEALNALAGKGFKVVIAGKVNENGLQEEIDLIKEKDPSIEMHLGYISDEDYHFYIQNSKYCILNYSGTYNDRSSGVVLDILFDGTPVVGQKCGALDIIKKNDIGCIYDKIESFRFETLMNAEQYSFLQNNIHSFIVNQKELVTKLMTFINNGAE